MATTAGSPASLPADELPLPLAFSQAFHLWSEQQAGCAAAPPPPDHLLALLARCASASASLFSRNEDQDDLTTASMRYLLVPAMQGDVLAASHARSPQARGAAVRGAAAAYAAFLARAGQYGLLGGPGAPARGAAEGIAGGRALDPGAAREAKVARFKRSRALAATIAQLSARQRRASAAAGEEEAEEVGGGWSVARQQGGSKGQHGQALCV
jgi:hypothetical protein